MDEYEISTPRTSIHLKITKVGDDMDVIIAGGKEHIGCVGVISNNSYTINTIKNHREDDIVLPIAKKLSALTDRTIVIKAGIHVDNITKAEIKSILGSIEKMLDIIMDYL
ncbi:hypothetical protein [Methanosphaera sp. BMS]|uniref:prenylated flavin chaperone LpdD n=1 Tax=Methanosphaera sp. BMS TaxID=1789762 RepID=UPI000DC1EB7B|nr:hypothetical protein [Methanosphaera sp. BMS]AWX33343.1 hypothetical protein AW729_09685 [Methanosphaera sp. BMS]